jgi:hypothetical protein
MLGFVVARSGQVDTPHETYAMVNSSHLATLFKREVPMLGRDLL